MSKDNVEDEGTVSGDSVFATPCGYEDVDGKTLGNGKLDEPDASRNTPLIRDPEVSALPKRRRYSAAYKARIVEEAERCEGTGDLGALLRREGLYTSHLSKWRKLYRSGALHALSDDKRGRKATKNPLEDEVARLHKQNDRLAQRLEQAETIIEIQKKVSSMLGIPLNSIEDEKGE